MGHSIRAIIGDDNTIRKLADHWVDTHVEQLPQNYTMLYLTDRLFDDVTELFDQENRLDCSVLTYFTSAICELLKEGSFHSQLVYIETDYFGGYGTQAGVLLENGEITMGPISGVGVINRLLHEIGVWKLKGKDEFSSLGLDKYRRM